MNNVWIPTNFVYVVRCTALKSDMLGYGLKIAKIAGTPARLKLLDF